jgi:hypothetical protein
MVLEDFPTGVFVEDFPTGVFEENDFATGAGGGTEGSAVAAVGAGGGGGGDGGTDSRGDGEQAMVLWSPHQGDGGGGDGGITREQVLAFDLRNNDGASKNPYYHKDPSNPAFSIAGLLELLGMENTVEKPKRRSHWVNNRRKAEGYKKEAALMREKARRLGTRGPDEPFVLCSAGGAEHRYIVNRDCMQWFIGAMDLKNTISDANKAVLLGMWDQGSGGGRGGGGAGKGGGKGGGNSGGGDGQQQPFV